MAKVICTLPNASTLINGIKFVEHGVGVISEEISDDVAAAFARIKGYALAGVKAVEDDLAELRARAEALGLRIKGNWGKDRLASEVAKAEAKAGAQLPAPDQTGTDGGAADGAEGAGDEGTTDAADGNGSETTD